MFGLLCTQTSISDYFTKKNSSNSWLSFFWSSLSCYAKAKWLISFSLSPTEIFLNTFFVLLKIIQCLIRLVDTNFLLFVFLKMASAEGILLFWEYTAPRVRWDISEWLYTILLMCRGFWLGRTGEGICYSRYVFMSYENGFRLRFYRN